MAGNQILAVRDYGQSIWMDNLTRDLIQSGELQRLIEERGIRGITTNPAIFEKAISGSKLYDADIEAGIQAQKSVEQIYESLIFDDIRNACDILQPIYEESDGLDGYVSIKVHPTIADDTQATIEACADHCDVVDRLTTDLDKAHTLIENLKDPDIDIDLDQVMDDVAKDGIDKFIKPYQAIMQSLEGKVKQLASV